jgi:hypothetical protein
MQTPAKKNTHRSFAVSNPRPPMTNSGLFETSALIRTFMVGRANSNILILFFDLEVHPGFLPPPPGAAGPRDRAIFVCSFSHDFVSDS